MRNDERLIAALLEDACLTLEELSRVCAVGPDWVIDHVRDGLLSVAEEGAMRPMTGSTGSAPALPPADWRFGSRELARARQMLRLERDFDAVPELAALVADLIEERDDLRARLRRAGLI